MSEVENKKEYEMAYLLAPDILEENVDVETAELKKVISESGGEIADSISPKKRRLAYQIRKQDQAYFGVFYFNIDSEGIDKIRKALALNKKLLRYLILNETLKEPPKPKIEMAPVKLSDEPLTQSFDKKLESILNR